MLSFCRRQWGGSPLGLGGWSGSPVCDSLLRWAADQPMTICREFGVHFYLLFRSRKGWAAGKRSLGLLPGAGGWQPVGFGPVTSWASGRVWVLGRGRQEQGDTGTWHGLMLMFVSRDFHLDSHLGWSRDFRGGCPALRTCPCAGLGPAGCSWSMLIEPSSWGGLSLPAAPQS